MNVMDNQATEYIKQFLTKKEGVEYATRMKSYNPLFRMVATIF